VYIFYYVPVFDYTLLILLNGDKILIYRLYFCWDIFDSFLFYFASSLDLLYHLSKRLYPPPTVLSGRFADFISCYFLSIFYWQNLQIFELNRIIKTGNEHHSFFRK